MGNCTSASTNASVYEVYDIENSSSSSATSSFAPPIFTPIHYQSRGAISDLCTGWDTSDELILAEGFDETTTITSTVGSTSNGTTPNGENSLQPSSLQPSIMVYSLQKGTIVKKFTGHERSITRISLSPSSSSDLDTHHTDYERLLASGSRDLSIHIYSYGRNRKEEKELEEEINNDQTHSHQQKPLSVLKGHEFSISALAFAKGNKRLASGGRDTSVRIWDIVTSSCVSKQSIPQNVVTCMKWYPTNSSSSDDNSSILIQGSEDLRVRVWDTRSKLQCLKIMDGYVYFPLALDVSMDGKYILTSSKGFNGIGCELRVWDIRKPNQAIVENSSSSLSSASSGNEYTSVDDFFQNIQPLQRFQYPGHTQDTTGCSFIRQPLVYQPKNDAPEETIVCFVSCSKDSTVKLWNQNNPNKCLCEYVQSDAGGFTALSVLENKDKPSVDEETKRVNNTTHHHHHPYPRIAVVSSQGGIFVYQIEYIHYQFQFKLMYRT